MGNNNQNTNLPSQVQRMQLANDNSSEFPCPNECCAKIPLKFQTIAELNKHIIEVHKCPKENCNFSSPDDKVLLAHILNHRTVNSKDLACKFCDDIFVDITSLENHIQAVHTLKCNVCLQTDFASLSSL